MGVGKRRGSKVENFITGDKYNETMAKLAMLGVKRSLINGWAKVIDTEEYNYEYDRRLERHRVTIQNNQQLISISIEDKKTIIKNLKEIVIRKKYLELIFKDERCLLVTRQGKVIELGREIYSKKADRKFTLKHDTKINGSDAELMVLELENEQAIAVINEAGRVLRIDTGFDKIQTAVIGTVVDPNSTEPEPADYTIYITSKVRIEGLRSKALYVDKELNADESMQKGNTEGLNWDYL